MRIDRFLNITNLVKRRSLAQDMCNNGVIKVNGNVVKSGRYVSKGNIIDMMFLGGNKRFLILGIPTKKTLPKSQVKEFIQEI